MKIDLDLILRLENLCKLNLTDDERKIISSDLEEILDMVSKLDEVDLSDVKPLRHMSEVANRLRDDEVKPSLPREDALKNAPSSEKGYFKVPKVLKK